MACQETVWWYVYKGTNRTRREIYYGVSIDPVGRIDGKHCEGATVAIAHWRCGSEKVDWDVVSRHLSQPTATKLAHKLERQDAPRGYRNILTAGI